jgi:hypothetical protein
MNLLVACVRYGQTPMNGLTDEIARLIESEVNLNGPEGNGTGDQGHESTPALPKRREAACTNVSHQEFPSNVVIVHSPANLPQWPPKVLPF